MPVSDIIKKTVSAIMFLIIFMVTPLSAGRNWQTDKWNISGVELTADDGIKDTWNKVAYAPVTDDEDTKKYINLLNRELSLYPEDYLIKANVQRIVICRDLAFDQQYRAAVPDPYKGIMYYSSNGQHGNAPDDYLVYVIHHELHHMVEFAIWKDFRYDWPEWQRLNVKGFKYGPGGEIAYTDLEKDYYSATHPQKGFINLYCMTGDEEDRADIMAYMMSDIDRHTLVEFCKEDEILRKKVTLLSQLVHKFSGTKFINTGLIVEK